mgnify:CR=1 FL=1
MDGRPVCFDRANTWTWVCNLGSERPRTRVVHAALVCSQLEIIALFGTGQTLEEGASVKLPKAGEIIILEPVELTC